MTKRQEKLNIQVAEAMGWKDIDSRGIAGRPPKKKTYRVIPNYLYLDHFFNARGGVMKKIKRMGRCWSANNWEASEKCLYWFHIYQPGSYSAIATNVTEAGCKAFVEMMKNE